MAPTETLTTACSIKQPIEVASIRRALDLTHPSTSQEESHISTELFQVITKSPSLTILSQRPLENIVNQCTRNLSRMVGKLLKETIGHDALKNMTALGNDRMNRDPIPFKIYADIKRTFLISFIITDFDFFLLI